MFHIFVELKIFIQVGQNLIHVIINSVPAMSALFRKKKKAAQSNSYVSLAKLFPRGSYEINILHGSRPVSPR